MLVLGVCNATDSGACLISDGQILAAANEERFLREKNVSTFPLESIRYVLDSQNVTPDDLDWVGCGGWKGIDSATTLPRLVEDIVYQMRDPDENTAREIVHRVKTSATRDQQYRRQLVDGLAQLGLPPEKLILCDHHYAHALTAFYCSPFDQAHVYTADGRGDHRSATLWSAERSSGLTLVDLATELTSPGALYGLITNALGFTPDRHEGKVTGLAARGRTSAAFDLLRTGFSFDREAGRIRAQIGDFYRPFLSAHWPQLAQALERFRPEDIAHAVQRLLEETLSGFLMKAIGAYPSGSVNLCLAGGCMGNVKLNFELSRLRPVRRIFVFPAMGDGGNAVGGAINVFLAKSSVREFPLPTVYLGPEYPSDRIHRALKESGLKFRELETDQKIRAAVQSLIAGRVVGWFQGRMELGPRALGARSILAPATDARANDLLNSRLDRSEFMPFAPVTTDRAARDCFQDWHPDDTASYFMTTCYKCTQLLRRKCPAVVHLDDTARPQVVLREQNPDYYDVIAEYIRQSGVPALINTSFNHHEDPIVNTPEEALQCFRERIVDVLVIEDFLVDQAAGS